MNFRSIILFLHRWIGLLTGSIVFILGITGCIYVLEPVFGNAFRTDLIYTEDTSGKRNSLSEIEDLIKEELSADHISGGITTYRDASRSLKAVLYQEDPEAGTYFGAVKDHRTVYVDPNRPENMGVVHEKYAFFNLVKALHKSLLLSVDKGRPVTAWSTVIFLFMLITGLFLWWPRKWNEAGIAKSFRITTDKGSKRTYYDLHNVLGFYSSVFAVVIGFTGLYWAFPGTVERSLNFITGGGYQKPANTAVSYPKADPGLGEGSEPLDLAYEIAWKTYEDAFSITFLRPQKPGDPIMAIVQSDADTRYRKGIMHFDPETGALVSEEAYADKTAGAKLVAMTYDIHTGNIAGWPGRSLAFMVSLISTSLPVTGFIVWFSRFGRKSRRF